MNFSMNRMFSFAVLASVFSMGLTQAAQQAKFHLPVTAKWGNAWLQPGDYDMTLPTPSAGNWQIYLSGAGKRLYALPLITEVHEPAKRSYLKLVKVDGSYFVKEYSSGPVGKSFTFAIPKASKADEQMVVGTN